MGDLILVASPYAIEAARGNSVSARRIAGILQEVGYQPQHVEGTSDGTHEGVLMIALHARKSAPAIRAFKVAYPERPLVVLLTGTDLHADLFKRGKSRDTVLESMRQADRLVVCQEGSVRSIPENFLHKLVLVPKSVNVRIQEWKPATDRNPFQVILASHLRPAKDPLLITEAVTELPDSSRIEVRHFGNSESATLGKVAEASSVRLGSRYQWKGAVARDIVMQELSTAHLALNTSKVEGGANALAEPQVMGVPCVATAIAANKGMLGFDHPGLFPMGDSKALAEMLWRAESDPAFYRDLKEASRVRGPSFTREAERSAWNTVLVELLENWRA